MSRKARRQVTDLVTPRLEEGEEILGAASPGRRGSGARRCCSPVATSTCSRSPTAG